MNKELQSKLKKIINEKKYELIDEIIYDLYEYR